MITKDTPFREVYAHPVGKQILDILLQRVGRSPALIGKVMVGYVDFGSIEFLIGKLAHSQAEQLVQTMAQMANRTPAPTQEELEQAIGQIVPQFRREKA